MSETVAITSRIERATVFRAGAELLRTAELDTPERFPAELTLGNLPLQLRDETVQLTVEPVDEGELTHCPQAVDFEITLEPPPPDPALPPASDEELRAAERAVAQRRQTFRRLEDELEALEALTPPDRPDGAEGEPPPRVPASARLDLLTLRRSEQERLLALLEPAREALRVAREARQQLEARREAERKRRQLPAHALRKQLRITLRAPLLQPPAPRFRLRVSYLVPAARWMPAYTLHIDEGQLRLGMRAQLCQASGEDWAGVQLVLSSADALRWSDLPELSALRIGRAQPAPQARWRPAPEGAEALYEDYRAARAEQSGDSYDGPPPSAPPVASRQPVALREETWEEDIDDARAELGMMVGAVADEECEAAWEPAPVAACEAPAPPRSMAKRARRMAPQAEKALFAANAPPGPQAAPMPGGGGRPPEPPLPPGLDAGRDLLDYDGLRMAGPDEPSAGKLRPIDSLARYRELLPPELRQRLPGRDAVRAHLEEVTAKVWARPAPAGHRAPASVEAFDHAWRSEQPVEVPGDGRFHTVPVLSAQAQGALRYVAVPREATEVFRTVELDNPLAAPLLAGPVDVYLDGDYLLAAQLETVPGGGAVQLGLGVEEGIRVARNTRYEEKQRGMVSRHQDLEHVIEIEARNLLSAPVLLEIRERVPVVREGDDDIELRIGAVEPPWQAWERPRSDQRGGYRWRLELPPGQVRQLRATYIITISPKHELVGGNRREA
jgi:hypothetical protein